MFTQKAIDLSKTNQSAAVKVVMQQQQQQQQGWNGANAMQVLEHTWRTGTPWWQATAQQSWMVSAAVLLECMMGTMVLRQLSIAAAGGLADRGMYLPLHTLSCFYAKVVFMHTAFCADAFIDMAPCSIRHKPR